jgi:UDP-2-acetamido-2-deoxy-ribo-hexuluronate aminotransferase
MVQGNCGPGNTSYPLPLHLQGAFSHLGYQPEDFPISDKIARRIFSLPMHPYLKSEQQDIIMQALRSGK